MSVLIIGSEGSMGKRYQAILKYLEKPFHCHDKKISCPPIETLANKASAIIVATPTETHFNLLCSLGHLPVPILCEKPLTKKTDELMLIEELFLSEKVNLTMMMQYRFLDDPESLGDSSYNYFRHGSDGLTWDCLQIIGLARGRVFLKEDSPIWLCELNGKALNISDMDRAYVDFIKKWFEKPGDEIKRVIDIHRKVMEFAA